MKGSNSRKIKLLKIWEILNRDTDENNPMSTPVLIEKLSECGIEVDRKILYSDIKLLNNFGYEVMCHRSSSNEYYVADRKFDIPEIHILMDAVKAAGFITEKKTDELVNKIAQLAGSQRAEVLTRNVVEFNTTKSVNENIYYSVYEIATAIEEEKKITFTYFALLELKKIMGYFTPLGMIALYIGVPTIVVSMAYKLVKKFLRSR